MSMLGVATTHMQSVLCNIIPIEISARTHFGPCGFEVCEWLLKYVFGRYIYTCDTQYYFAGMLSCIYTVCSRSFKEK